MAAKLLTFIVAVSVLLLTGVVVSLSLNETREPSSNTENTKPKEFMPGPIGQPFERPLVTITFDDGFESQFSKALPVLKRNNFPATFYLSTGLLNTEGYMTDGQVKELILDGHHIGAHTSSHPRLTALSEVEVEKELDEPKIYLQTKFGINARDFASPYGDVNEPVMQKVIDKYRSHRNVLSGFNYRDTFDIYGVKVQNILVSTTAEEVAAWVDAAKTNNAWLVLAYHQIDNAGDDYSVTPDNFALQMEAIAKSGVNVVDLDDALAEVLKQTN